MSARPRVLDELVAGLTDASFRSFVGVALVAAVELAAAALLLTPRAFARLPMAVFMTNGDDDQARVSVLAAKLHASRPGALSVVYLGASTANHALLDSFDPRPMERALSARVGEHVRFWSMYSSLQLFEESLLLVRQLPAGFRGVVAVMIHDDKDDHRAKLHMLEHDPDVEERLAVDPPDPAEHKIGYDGRTLRRTGCFFVDHLGFFAARRFNFLEPVPVWPQPLLDRFRYPPRPGVEEYEAQRFWLNPHPLVVRHLTILGDMAREARARGAEIVFVEAPANPRVVTLLRGAQERYVTAIRSFSASVGAAYWDLNDDVQLTREDFQDAIHLGTVRARRRYEQAFVERLTPLLRARRAPGAGGARRASDQSARSKSPS
ncbi:MAG TPA: hypothetical protein VHB21_14570, partial [Minicystis sp.]|nr:hypothetical protein [Minicystis sp.]